MTRPSAGSLAGAVLLCYVLAAGFFLVLSLIAVPGGLLPSMLRMYVIRSALLRTIEGLPALSVAGALIAYTLFANSGRSHTPGTVQEVLRPALIVLLTLTLGYLVADALATPRLRGSLSALAEASLRAHQYRAAMDAAAARADQTGSVRDWEEAREAAARYLAIDPDNAEIQRRENELHESLLQARDRVADDTDTSAGSAVSPGPQEAARPPELLAMAQSYYDQGDYYSAHYYASLAQSSPEVARRASALVAAADARISPDTPLDRKATPEEVESRLLAERKRDAYELFRREDWVTAYYRFGELEAQYPEDADIGRFRVLARERAMTAAFIIDEAREALKGPGVEALLFATRQGDEIAVVSIGKMVGPVGGTYFEDVETLRYRPGPGPTLHLYARYGKLAGEGILLRALDAERRELSEEPVVVVAPNGANPRVEGSMAEDPMVGDPMVIRKPPYDLDSLRYIRPGARALREVPAIALWGMRTWARDSGILREALDLELLLFFVRPALFLALGLMGVALARKLRGHYYGRPALVAYSAVGLVPFALSGVWQLVVDGTRLLYGTVVALGGFLPAAITAAAVQGALLVVALIGMSRSALE